MYPRLLLIIILYSATILRAEELSRDDKCVDAGLETISQEVNGALHLGNASLFLTRRPDLENDLIDLQYIAKAASLPPGVKLTLAPIEIFEIGQGGYKVHNDRVEEAQVDLDDAPTWRIAYNRLTKDIFHLYGFPDSRAGFNGLIGQLGLTVDTESLAVDVQSTFVKLTYLDSSDDEVRDELQLMKAAVKNYGGQPRSVTAYIKFWNKCPLTVRTQIAPPSASKTLDGIRVTFFTEVGRTISRTTIAVTHDGHVGSLESKQLFVWPK